MLLSNAHKRFQPTRTIVKMTKVFVPLLWAAGVVLANALGELLAYLSGVTDWAMVGWAFGGSTAFVAWEALQRKAPIKRTGWERLLMIAIGMFISLGLNAWVSDLTKIPPIPCTIMLGAAGYKLFGKLQERVDKKKNIEDLTKLGDE